MTDGLSATQARTVRSSCDSRQQIVSNLFGFLGMACGQSAAKGLTVCGCPENTSPSASPPRLWMTTPYLKWRVPKQFNDSTSALKTFLKDSQHQETISRKMIISTSPPVSFHHTFHKGFNFSVTHR